MTAMQGKLIRIHIVNKNAIGNASIGINWQALAQTKRCLDKTHIFMIGLMTGPVYWAIFLTEPGVSKCSRQLNEGNYVDEKTIINNLLFMLQRGTKLTGILFLGQKEDF